MTFEKIRDIIGKQFDIDPNDITEATAFLADLGADSLDVVELAMNMEDEFGLPEIEPEQLQSIQTVGDLVDYVTRALG